MLLRLQSLELVQLFRQPGGAEFVSFGNELLYALAWQLGIPASDVWTCSRTDIPDGGVDARIASGRDTDSSGFLRAPTAWQFKATGGDSIGPADIRRELAERPSSADEIRYVRNCIIRGDGYRFCVADFLTPQKREQLQNEIDIAVSELNQHAPRGLVLSLDDLVQLANAFPALVLRYKSSVASQLKTLQAWRASVTAVTRNYVPGSRFDITQKAILTHCDLNQPVNEVVLPIQGAAGVGKTRAVYESLRQLPAAESVVVYTDDEEDAVGLSNILANDTLGGGQAILVADECSLATRQQIANALRGATGRVRCICVDNSSDHLSTLAPELSLEKLPTAEVEQILAANFQSVPSDRRRVYASLCEGFIRLAADMCRFDPQIGSAGAISPVLSSLQAYYHARLDVEQRIAVQTIALLRRVKHKGEGGRSEFDLLCSLVGQDPRQIAQRLSLIKDSPGFIERGALYYRATPQIIAIIALTEAWREWAEPNSDDFLSRIPAELQESFLQRVSESGSQEVRETVRRFFRRFADNFTPRELADLKLVNRFIQLVETDPNVYLPSLRRVVESASPEELLAGSEWEHGGWGPRRQLVWLAERIAQFPEFFPDAEAILFALANEESEPKIGNNATKTWQRLFRLYLSGTSIPLIERLRVLGERLSRATIGQAELFKGALDMILDFHGSRVLGPPVMAGRIPPPDWEPRTQDEARKSIDAALALVRSAMAHPVVAIADGAKRTLINNADALVRAGWLTQLRRSFSDFELEEGLRANLVRNLKYFLRLRKIPDSIRYEEGYLGEVQDWIKELEPKSIMGRLREVVGSSSWDHFQHEKEYETELESLATAMVSDSAFFNSALDWLTSSEARSAAEFGVALAAKDRSGAYLDAIVEKSRRGQIGLARGYINGLIYRAEVNPKKLNELLDRLELENPSLAFLLALAGGKPLSSLDRALRLVKSGKLPPSQLRNFTHWIGNERTSNEEAIRAVNLLLPMAQSGQSDAADTIVDLLAARLSSGTFDALLKEHGKLLCDVLSTVMPDREAFWWHRLMAKAVGLCPQTVISAATRAMIGDNFELREQAKNLVANLGSTYPDLVMDAIGHVVLSEETGWHFFMSKYPVFTALPLSVVEGWMRKNGVAAARKVARHVPKPYLNADGSPGLHPLTEFLLREFEQDDRTFIEFCAGVHSLQMYMGDIAAAREREGLVAKAFLNHPLRRAREWAQHEEESARADAQRHREMMDEMDA